MDEPPARRSVTLRHVRDAEGLRVLEARELGDGTIQIEGHDLGPGVAAFWGSGLTEYEWVWTIRPADVQRALETLGGSPGDAALGVLRDWFDGHDRDPGQALREAGATVEFWSRIGD